MVSKKMPSKNPKAKSRKRSASNSSGSAESQPNHVFDEAHLRSPGVSQDAAMLSRPVENAGGYYPGYRENMPMGMAPPGMHYGANMIPVQQSPPGPNTMGRSNGLTGPPGSMAPQSAPFPFSQPGKPGGPVVENGYSHSSPASSTGTNLSTDRDAVSKILEQNAQIILQINQAVMDGRLEVFSELMPVLSKNITYLNSLPEQPGAPSSHNAMPPPSEPAPHPARISQSPQMLRPMTQGTPPHMSPPPGQYMANGQQFVQPPPHSTYGHPPQQPRPQPVYSPLTQSTHAPGQPVSPNLPFQSISNGPARPQGYAQQGYAANAGMGAVSSVMSQQQHPPANTASNSMPPPMNYPFSVPSRSTNASNYGGGYNYPAQESTDPNYAAMPPPQMQPQKRSVPAGFRAAAPQGNVHEQRPQSYQTRMYMDSYAQQAQQPQQQMQYPGSHQSAQQFHHQQQQQQHVQTQHPGGMMPPPSNSFPSGYAAPLPSGQYSMPSPTQAGQFRSPASPYGMPSPAGSTGSSS